MNLTDMRTNVRRDLHDEDALNYRWTDDEIDRHIAHALKEFSESIPYEQKATIATTAGSREIDISSLSDRIMIQAVEYLVDKFPKSYQRFALWEDTLTFLGDDVPDGSNCYIYYGKLHDLALDPDIWQCNTSYSLGDFVAPSTPNGFVYECTVAGTSHPTTEPTWPTIPGQTVVDNNVWWICRLDPPSTIPAQHEDLVALGAEGYALVEWAAFAINQVNLGGTETPRIFRTQGTEKLVQFRKELKRLGRRSKARVSRMYTPATAIRSMTTDPGP